MNTVSIDHGQEYKTISLDNLLMLTENGFKFTLEYTNGKIIEIDYTDSMRRTYYKWREDNGIVENYRKSMEDDYNTAITRVRAAIKKLENGDKNDSDESILYSIWKCIKFW